jgi:hypothetical protein
VRLLADNICYWKKGFCSQKPSLSAWRGGSGHNTDGGILIRAGFFGFKTASLWIQADHHQTFKTDYLSVVTQSTFKTALPTTCQADILRSFCSRTV